MRKRIENICKECNITPEFTKDSKLKDSKLTKKSKKEFSYKVNWYNVSQYQKLSEEFIREFADKVNWYKISANQKLSEEFIQEFSDKVNWNLISKYQELSEEFIRDFKDKVNWYKISANQKLSEEFIRDFSDKVDWNLISKYQELSKEFIRDFKDKVNWNYIFKHQKFLKKFGGLSSNYYWKSNKISNDCWLYKSVKFKLKYIRENTNYEIVDNKYIIAYKGVGRDMRSIHFPLKYKYKVGKKYTSRCDYNTNENDSYGLSAWTKERALDCHSTGKLLRVKIEIKDVGAIVKDSNKIRCRKLKVLEVVKI